MCWDSGTSRWEDEFILSNFGVASQATQVCETMEAVYSVLGTLDLCIVECAKCLLDSCPTIASFPGPPRYKEPGNEASPTIGRLQC